MLQLTPSRIIIQNEAQMMIKKKKDSQMVVLPPKICLKYPNEYLNTLNVFYYIYFSLLYLKKNQISYLYL